MTARALLEAAPLLGQPRDPRWADVAARLPLYAAAPVRPERPEEGERIGLWQGVDLPRSHRHHSHLAAIWPFCTLDLEEPRQRRAAAESLQHWSHLGAGEWTGWCVPWASILCARCDLADAALLWLRWWQYLYTNEGGGTLHNADFPGCAAWHDGALGQPGFRKPEPFNEIMQADAAMAAVTAVLELLAQQRGDTLHILPRLPKAWRELEFDGVRTEGAFLVGARVRDGRVEEIRVQSLAGARLKLAHHLGERWLLNGRPRRGPLLETNTRAGQTLLLRTAAAW